MNKKITKIINLICCSIILFFVINMLIIPSKASAANIVNNTIQFNNKSVAPTPPKTNALATVIVAAVKGGQVLVSGYFVIRITIEGIRYFISVAASEKASCTNAIFWNIFLAVISLLGFELVIWLLGYN